MRRLNQLSKFSRIFDWISRIFDLLESDWNMSHLIDLDVAFYMHFLFLSIALHISTAHDFRVISARTWARARTKRKEISLKLSSIAK